MLFRSPGGNVLNVERASTSASMPKGKKGKKKKPSAKGPRVKPTLKLVNLRARAKEIVSNARNLATGRGTARTS